LEFRKVVLAREWSGGWHPKRARRAAFRGS